jgi:NAD+ synthase (glutamine-hydrolysing)
VDFGFVRVAAITPNVKPGDIQFNADEIISKVFEAEKKGVNIAVFPELCITGYSCGDLFLQRSMTKAAALALKTIADKTKDADVLFFVGLPIYASGKLINAAAAVKNGCIEGFNVKQHIANYNEYYEERYFHPTNSKEYVLFDDFNEDAVHRLAINHIYKFSDDVTVGVEICEDLWVPNPPSTFYAQRGAHIIVNLSASNALIGKDSYRRDLVKSQSARLICGYVYANAGVGESTSDCVWDGHSLIAENGVILTESKKYENGMIITDIDVERLENERIRMSTYDALSFSGDDGIYYLGDRKIPEDIIRKYPRFPFVPHEQSELASRCGEIIAMQAHALAHRLDVINCKTAVIGVSGGLDSTLALLVTAEAFDICGIDRSGIAAHSMPCFGTTSRTKSNAEKLSKALGVSFSEIDISDSVKAHFKDLKLPETDRSVTYENAQARERTQLLMDTANLKNGIVIGTCDLSEIALGWSTYNGDHMSMFHVNASVPKTLVKFLVDYVRKTASEIALQEVLQDVLHTPVSPELLPPENGEISQKTEDLVGPYELHDFFLYYFVRCGFAPEKILKIAEPTFAGVYPKEIISKWLDVFINRFFKNQFKRNCTPDGVKIGSVSLSPRADWRMPSDVSSEYLKYLNN